MRCRGRRDDHSVDRTRPHERPSHVDTRARPDRPRGHRGLWELLLLQKTLFTVHALLNLDLPRGVQTAWVDASLVVFTAVALVLCRGWLSWRPRSA